MKRTIQILVTGAGLLLMGACDDSSVEQALPVKESRGKPGGKADGANAPAGWDCAPSYYDRNDGCDCGCGIIDPDCSNGGEEACDYEWCPTAVSLDPNQNWQCESESDDGQEEAGSPSVPDAWSCSVGFYGTDDGCDCGCGVHDPDCVSSSASACQYEYCPFGEDPLPNDNAQCDDPDSSNDGSNDDGSNDDGADGGSSDGGPGDVCGLPRGASCGWLFDNRCSEMTTCRDDDDGAGFICHDYCEERYSDGICNGGCYDSDPDCLSQGALVGQPCERHADCRTEETHNNTTAVACLGGVCADTCEANGYYEPDHPRCASLCAFRDPSCGVPHPTSHCLEALET